MICTKCKKRIAVVFITTMQGNEKKNEGLCLICAKDMGLPQVDEYIKQMGLSDDELEESYKAMFGDIEDFEDGEDGEDFKPGGANTMPKFLQSLIKRNDSDRDISANDNVQYDSRGSDKKVDKSKSKKEDKKRRFLETYCTSLTRKAKNNELDRVIGRDKEIYRVTQILSRRTKNNPCLIGEPGVGKTAIAEGIAQLIASDKVPFRLKNKEIYLLDLTALVAGTQFRGQFESRAKALIDEIKNAGNIILFIDEVHNLVGTGDSEGTMNAANIFKPALSRGEMQVIGATTFNEYRKYIEKDSALERRFQPVKVGEPTIDDTIEVLKGIKDYYEKHHKVKVSDEIIRMCVILSERYITDRFLPDKAIDLLDEASACASIKNKDLDEYEKLVVEVNKINEEMDNLQDPQNGEIDYEKLANLRIELAKKQEKIDKLKPLVDGINVTLEDVSKVIELWTGIPANKIVEAEYKKIANLENVLKSKILGQDEACEVVAAAVKRSRVQLSARRRPASFIFVGPTGVGKTELVKVLASELFDTVDPLIRLDMSEFMERHSVSKIIGSPPGYVGYDEAGQLTEKVRRKPYSVVLFDEIEKAHPDVMNILLQILDEGRVNDAQGRSVSFENTVICMTSNAGSTDKSTGVGFGRSEIEVSKDRAMKGLRDFLRPEFLSRIDEIVVFKPLSEKDYGDIAKLMLEEMREPLNEKRIELIIDEKTYSAIAKKAFGGKFGGRDIRRVIRKDIEDKIANIIIENNDKKIKSINITAEDDNIKVSFS